jgi:glycosyltransferase involved in cell wall biosynthesis
MNISFVIPVYNADASLTKCLESIVPYLLKGCEAVVVNDGSTDASVSIIETFAKKYNGIKLINQENKGQSAARNEAIRKASGEYIWCLDSDDWISEDGIAVVKEALDKALYDVVVIGRVEEYKNSSKATPQLIYKEYNNGVDFFNDASLNGTYRTQPWNIIVKRSLILENDVFFPEGRTFEDIYWGINLFLHAERVVTLPIHPYHYFLANENSLTKQIHQRDMDAVWIIDEAARLLDESDNILTSDSPSFLTLIYWFVSSAIMKKYMPLYDTHQGAREIVNALLTDEVFKKSVRYAAFHYIGLTRSGLALLLFVSPTLYKVSLKMLLAK